MGTLHPECSARLSAIGDYLIPQGLDHYLAHHEAPLATFKQLLRVHSVVHLEHLKWSSPSLGIVYLDPDTVMNSNT